MKVNGFTIAKEKLHGKETAGHGKVHPGEIEKLHGDAFLVAEGRE